LELKNVLPRLTDEAVAVIRKHAPRSSAQPLLLYFAPTGPHTPWLPAEEYRGRSAAGLYGDFTMMVDAMIGRLLAALEEAHMAEDTLVIFTSDNGPTWYPEDVARTGHDSAAGLRGMKGTHFEGGHRMPLVVRWPGRVRPGTVSRQLMGFTDVVATVAATVPAPLPAGAAADSLSFLPVLLGTQPEDRPIRETLVVGQSLRRGNWKWIEGREPVAFGKPQLGTVPTQGKAPGMLFDLANDPAEKLDLASQRADLAEELRTELQRIRSTTQTRR